ncbi:MAG: DMT family transporter, partial [Candidatus Aminicenantia bacterium]
LDMDKKFTFIDLLMLMVILIWGLNLSVIKISLKEIPPMPFNGIRLLLSSLLLIIASLIAEGNLKIQKKHLFKISFLSIIGYTIYQLLFIEGINLTTASNAAVILGTSPIIISIFSSYFKHEKIRFLGWIGIILGFAGLYIVISGKAGKFHISQQTLRGDLLLLSAVVLWSYYSVASKPLLKIYSPLKFTCITMTIGSLLFFPFSIIELKNLPFQSISLQAWVWLIYSGAFALSLSLVIWFISVKKVGNSQTAIYSNLQPVFAVIFAHFILSESITSNLVTGFLIIFLGIYLARVGKERK